jgi:hypothetical protein
MAVASTLLTVGFWLVFFGGLLVLYRRQVVERRQAELCHQRALRALARAHAGVPPRG